MIYFFTPYSFEKKLFEAYDSYINLLPDENDWACLVDGDACFFENNFGHQVQEYISKYPDTGIFTSYASRCGYKFMVPENTDQECDSIKYHRIRSQELYEKLNGQVKEINDNISGHLICIKKSTWLLIKDELFTVCAGANLLGVDTQISSIVLGHGLKIRLMKGIYLFHYYRFAEGKSYKQHLIDQKINILIRTSNRKNLFNRCIESVKKQTHKDINILVSADDDNTAEYVRKSGIDPLLVEKLIKTEKEPAPYNIYLNKLIDQVKGGWIFILDDDDYLADETVLEKLARQLIDDNVIYLFRMKWANGRIIPSAENFNRQLIVRSDIGMPCFIFHAKHKHKLQFQSDQLADYHFIVKITAIVKKQKWIDLILTQIGNTGGHGKPESEIN
jgi:hypothetical protein